MGTPYLRSKQHRLEAKAVLILMRDLLDGGDGEGGGFA